MLAHVWRERTVTVECENFHGALRLTFPHCNKEWGITDAQGKNSVSALIFIIKSTCHQLDKYGDDDRPVLSACRKERERERRKAVNALFAPPSVTFALLSRKKRRRVKVTHSLRRHAFLAKRNKKHQLWLAFHRSPARINKHFFLFQTLVLIAVRNPPSTREY